MGKEGVRLPLHEEHCSLEAVKKHIVAHAGLKTEAEEHGLVSSIKLKLCRLAKTAKGSKAQNLPSTVYESIRRVVQWAAYYYTHEKSYYPVVSRATPLDALPRLTYLKPVRKLNDRE